MYSGHGRLCVCARVSVCLSLTAFPHYCTDPDVTWGNGSGVPSSCALFGRIGAQVLLLWQHSAECEMSASACTRCMPGYYFAHTCTKSQLVKTQLCNCAAKHNWTAARPQKFCKIEKTLFKYHEKVPIFFFRDHLVNDMHAQSMCSGFQQRLERMCTVLSNCSTWLFSTQLWFRLQCLCCRKRSWHKKQACSHVPHNRLASFPWDQCHPIRMFSVTATEDNLTMDLWQQECQMRKTLLQPRHLKHDTKVPGPAPACRQSCNATGIDVSSMMALMWNTEVEA